MKPANLKCYTANYELFDLVTRSADACFVFDVAAVLETLTRQRMTFPKWKDCGMRTRAAWRYCIASLYALYELSEDFPLQTVRIRFLDKRHCASIFIWTWWKGLVQI